MTVSDFTAFFFNVFVIDTVDGPSDVEELEDVDELVDKLEKEEELIEPSKPWEDVFSTSDEELLAKLKPACDKCLYVSVPSLASIKG